MSAHDAETLRRIFDETSSVAVVGCSADPRKPANRVPSYLQGVGYRIAPVNPREEELLGERVHESLEAVDLPVDLVLVFRPADEAPAIARAAVTIGARTLWLQDGIVSAEAEQAAQAGGLNVVMGRCIGRAHRDLGLGPGP